MATMQYTMECYFNDNPVLSQAQLYEFEPCDNDQITKLSIEHNAGLCLSKEARRWATCVAKETRVIRDSHEELKKLISQLGDKDCIPTQIPLVISEQGPQVEIETRIDDLRQTIRKAQTSKKKAEARLDAMREAGVNVDEWMRPSETGSVSTEASVDVLSRSGTVTSRASQRSYPSESYEAPSEANDTFYDSDNASETPVSAPADSVPEAPFAAELAAAEDVVAAVQSAWAAVDEVEESIEPEPEPKPVEPEPAKLAKEAPMVNGEVSPALCARCVALFSYQASNADELSFVEQEELELISEGDGDGWVKARNYRGEEGYIPQNYVEVIENQPVETSTRPPLTSFSSVDYSMPDEGEAETKQNGEVAPSSPPAPAPPPPAPAVSDKPTELPVSLENEVAPITEPGMYCRATYDYEATCDEELTFFEDQIIRIIRKNVTDVDDGWWEGELDGKIGLFPSLVVEELKENGEPMTPVDILSPVESAPPPAFSPPKPQLLVLPAQVILTQPTPEIECAEECATQKTLVIASDNPDFRMELPEKQQSQYHQQFSASDSESSEHEPPAPEDVGKYAPLVSSPDSPAKNMAASIKETPLEGIVEEKIEGDATNVDGECPTVVITEAKFDPAGFEDEFLYKEEKCLPDVEESVKEPAKEPVKEAAKEPESAFTNVDAFECTFPDIEDPSPIVKPMVVDKKNATQSSRIVSDSKMDQDTDVKMEVNNDSEPTAKSENDFFRNTDLETTG